MVQQTVYFWISVRAVPQVTVLDISNTCLFNTDDSFVINEGNGLSFPLIPTCILNCCACIKLADVLFGQETQENEWGTPWENGGQTEEWQEALSSRWVMESSLARRQDDTVPPTLITQLWLNPKSKRGDLCSPILLSVTLFLFLYLPAVKYVTQREPSLRQLMQTRLISWC